MENTKNSNLSFCIRNRNAQGIKTLIHGGTDPDARDQHDMTALMWAAWVGYAQFVEILLDEGADPYLEGPSPNPRGEIWSHPTALCFAQHGENNPPPFPWIKEGIADYKKVIKLLHDRMKK